VQPVQVVLPSRKSSIDRLTLRCRRGLRGLLTGTVHGGFRMQKLPPQISSQNTVEGPLARVDPSDLSTSQRTGQFKPTCGRACWQPDGQSQVEPTSGRRPPASRRW
jgi:hypothetical protein